MQRFDEETVRFLVTLPISVHETLKTISNQTNKSMSEILYTYANIIHRFGGIPEFMLFADSDKWNMTTIFANGRPVRNAIGVKFQQRLGDTPEYKIDMLNIDKSSIMKESFQENKGGKHGVE